MCSSVCCEQIAAHIHYTVDIVVAIYTTILVWYSLQWRYPTDLLPGDVTNRSEGELSLLDTTTTEEGDAPYHLLREP